MSAETESSLRQPVWEDFFDDDKNRFALRSSEVSKKLAEFNKEVPPLEDDEEFYLTHLAFNDKGYRRGYGLSRVENHIDRLREILDSEKGKNLRIPAFQMDSLGDGLYSIIYLVISSLGEGDDPVVCLENFTGGKLEGSIHDVYLSSPLVVDDEVAEAHKALESRDEEEDEFKLSDARGIENSSQVTSTEDAISIEDVAADAGEDSNSVEDDTVGVEEDSNSVEDVDEENTPLEDDVVQEPVEDEKTADNEQLTEESPQEEEEEEEISDEDIKEALSRKSQSIPATEDVQEADSKKRFGFFGRR